MREIFRREIRREKLAQNALLYTTKALLIRFLCSQPLGFYFPYFS